VPGYVPHGSPTAEMLIPAFYIGWMYFPSPNHVWQSTEGKTLIILDADPYYLFIYLLCKIVLEVQHTHTQKHQVKN